MIRRTVNRTKQVAPMVMAGINATNQETVPTAPIMSKTIWASQATTRNQGSNLKVRLEFIVFLLIAENVSGGDELTRSSVNFKLDFHPGLAHELKREPCGLNLLVKE